MAGRRMSIVHSVAEDRQRPSGQTGQPVSGFATFYWPVSGWLNIPPGRLDLAELWGGSSGKTKNQEQADPESVEFYIDVTPNNKPKRNRNKVALNGDRGDVFTFSFFGKRFS